MNLHICKTT